MNPYEPVVFDPPAQPIKPTPQPAEKNFDPLSMDQIFIKVFLTLLLVLGILIGLFPFLAVLSIFTNLYDPSQAVNHYELGICRLTLEEFF